MKTFRQIGSFRNGAIHAVVSAGMAHHKVTDYLNALRESRYSDVLNRAIILALAYDFTGHRDYRDGVIGAMDYICPMRNPHHLTAARQ